MAKFFNPYLRMSSVMQDRSESFGLLASSSIQGRVENCLALIQGFMLGDQAHPIQTAPEAFGLQQHCHVSL